MYQWTVPAVPVADDYTIVVDCNNSAGASLGVSASSGIFSITATGLELLSPPGKSSRACGQHDKGDLETKREHHRSGECVLSLHAWWRLAIARQQYYGK